MNFEAILKADADALEAATVEWAEANRDYEKARHGQMPATMGLSDEKLIQQVADDQFLPPLQDAEALVHRLASVVEANARDVLRKTDNPQPKLTDAEAAVAVHYATLYAVEAKALPLPQLASKAAAALRSGDRPETYSWMEPVKARLAEPVPPLQQTDADIQAARSELNGFLSGARELLIDRRDDALRAELTKARTGAQDAKRDVGTRAQATRRYSFQGPNDVPWDQPD